MALPHLKVPYVTTAFDLCDAYIDCTDANAGKPDGYIVTIDDDLHTAGARRHAIEKRARTAKGLKALAYPSSSKLYSGDRTLNKVEIYRFSSNQIQSTAVKAFQSIKSTESYGEDYASEHIIEVSKPKGEDIKLNVQASICGPFPQICSVKAPPATAFLGD